MRAEDIWDIEAGFSLAWPALVEKRVGGWLLKSGGGVSRRSNSANPTFGCEPIAQVLPDIESFYRQQRLPPLVRVLDFQPPSIGDRLEECGYAREGETRTLCAPLLCGDITSQTILEARPTAQWIGGAMSAQHRTSAQTSAAEAHLAQVRQPCAFGLALDDDREPVSWGYGVITDSRLYIESVVTRSDRRGQGFGTRLLRALLAWGKATGATASVLQVQADNSAACRLYETVGFTEELYRYRYWRAQAGKAEG